MGWIELLLTAVGLSMDAFAVSVCKGLGMRKMRYDQAFVIGLYFGVFQAIMPLLGWLLGTSFSRYIQAFDHWIAFILLAFIGGKMLWDVFHEKEEETTEKVDARLDHKELFMLAIATSIDALAVGIAFACLDVQIWSSISIIGCVTLVLSFCGVWIGNRFGNRFEKKAEIAVGLVLIWCSTNNMPKFPLFFSNSCLYFCTNLLQYMYDFVQGMRTLHGTGKTRTS